MLVIFFHVLAADPVPNRSPCSDFIYVDVLDISRADDTGLLTFVVCPKCTCVEDNRLISV